MTTPTTNISLNSIQTEFGGANPISLSEYYRGGARVPIGTANGGFGLIATSGALSVGTFRNTNAVVTVNLTISANTSNYNIYTAAGSPAGAANVTVTINNGVIVFGTSTATPAMDTGTGWAAGSTIAIINNGSIIGSGGTGAYSGNNGVSGNLVYGANGSNGGDALRAQYAVSVTNNGTIAGGGGGGGSGSNLGTSSGQPQNYGGNGNGGTGVAFPSIGGNGAGTTNTVTVLTAEGSTNIQGLAGGTYGNTNGTAGGIGGNQTPQSPRGFNSTTTLDPGNTQASAGGGGGGLGASGGTGAGVYNLAYGFHSTAGGYPGSYVIGNSNVTWSVNGTRVGLVDGLLVRLTPACNLLSISRGTPATVSTTLTFNSNGTISGTQVGLLNNTYAENWYKTTTAGIGSSYWIRITQVSATGLTALSSSSGYTLSGLGVAGPWVSLGSTISFTNTISSATTKQSKLSVEISSSASGTPIVASGVYYLRVYRPV